MTKPTNEVVISDSIKLYYLDGHWSIWQGKDRAIYLNELEVRCLIGALDKSLPKEPQQTERIDNDRPD